jgi:hypothetical protein
MVAKTNSEITAELDTALVVDDVTEEISVLGRRTPLTTDKAGLRLTNLSSPATSRVE